jgi:exodeoxyribonuclease VII large subunit
MSKILARTRVVLQTAMGQIPFFFDKKKKEPPAPPPPPQRPQVITVSELQRRLRSDLEEHYATVYVGGEISNYKLNAKSGHAYFTLKDEHAQVSCVMFRDAIARTRHRLNDGMELIVRGRVTIYEASGQLQINVQAVEPKGLGARQLEFQQRVEKLRKEGLTADARKRKIPAFPRCIGVVTSREGAALRDVLRTILRRDPFAHVVFSFAQVQGPGAAGDVVRALRVLDESKKCEVILLCRGGGSIEDLWCFNEEIVARTIAISTVPIITGIGHETDTTIADLVADLRVSTPTAAAEHVTAVRSELRLAVSQRQARLSRALSLSVQTFGGRLARLAARLRDPRAMIERRAQRLDELSNRTERSLRQLVAKKSAALVRVERKLARVDPAAKLRQTAHRFNVLEARLKAAIARKLERDRHRFEVCLRDIEARSPLAILSRGYALIFDEKGRLVKRADAVHTGDRLSVRLAKGGLRVRVEEDS